MFSLYNYISPPFYKHILQLIIIIVMICFQGTHSPMGVFSGALPIIKFNKIKLPQKFISQYQTNCSSYAKPCYTYLYASLVNLFATDWFLWDFVPLLFDIKWCEQTFRPGLCLSDSRMTVVHSLTIGIFLLDPYCLLRVQYCCFQFSCIVTDWVCGTMFPFYLTLNGMSRLFVLGFALVTVV